MRSNAHLMSGSRSPWKLHHAPPTSTNMLEPWQVILELRSRPEWIGNEAVKFAISWVFLIAVASSIQKKHERKVVQREASRITMGSMGHWDVDSWVSVGRHSHEDGKGEPNSFVLLWYCVMLVECSGCSGNMSEIMEVAWSGWWQLTMLGLCLECEYVRDLATMAWLARIQGSFAG